MSRLWNFLTKAVGTVVIVVTFVVSVAIAIDMIRQAIQEKLNADADDGADQCPYKIGDYE